MYTHEEEFAMILFLEMNPNLLSSRLQTWETASRVGVTPHTGQSMLAHFKKMDWDHLRRLQLQAKEKLQEMDTDEELNVVPEKVVTNKRKVEESPQDEKQTKKIAPNAGMKLKVEKMSPVVLSKFSEMGPKETPIRTAKIDTIAATPQHAQHNPFIAPVIHPTTAQASVTPFTAIPAPQSALSASEKSEFAIPNRVCFLSFFAFIKKPDEWTSAVTKVHTISHSELKLLKKPNALHQDDLLEQNDIVKQVVFNLAYQVGSKCTPIMVLWALSVHSGILARARLHLECLTQLKDADAELLSENAKQKFLKIDSLAWSKDEDLILKNGTDADRKSLVDRKGKDECSIRNRYLEGSALELRPDQCMV